MASTDSSPDLMKQNDSESASPSVVRSGAPDDPDAVIAALDEAEVAFDADADEIGRRPDSSADVIEILDAEPILSEDEGLAGAPDPVDLITRRARNETPRDRAATYERELAGETRKKHAAVLQHELAVHAERSISDEADVARAYATAMASDPALRPNLWALRRIFYRRSLWPSLLKLLDTEANSAPTKREQAEVWTEKGHILEDLLNEVDEAVVCYRKAHELDPSALAPLAALEKLLAQKAGPAGESGRPSEELLTVYRDLATATREPGRRVALLIEQARIEEEHNRAVEQAGGTPGDLDRVLSYLHDAYDVGIDQSRVIDEIVRITAASGRIPDCLAALEVRAEILEMQAQQATTQRRQALIDQVVAIRRWQASLARDRLGNAELAWQYLDKAQQKSPGDPLIMPDLIAMAESQGRHADLAALLQQREDQLQISRGTEGPPPLGLWLKRALALRSAGQNGEADELEQRIATYAPTHLLLLLGRQRRALRGQDPAALAELLRDEARLAVEGLTSASGEKQTDHLWALESLLLAADLSLQLGDLKRAEESLVAAKQVADNAGPVTGQALVLRRLLDEASEQLRQRGRRFGELAALYEQRLANTATADPNNPVLTAEDTQRLREALVDLYGDLLGEPAKALAVLRALCEAAPEDLRLWRRVVLLARRSGDTAHETAALQAIERLEHKLGLGAPRSWDLLRRAELLATGAGAAEAVALYEEVLKQRPGEPQALEPLERLLLAANKPTELAALWRKQIEVAAAAMPRGDSGRSDVGQRLLQLQVKLVELLQSDPEQAGQAVAVYRSILAQRPGYWPALRGLAQQYRRQNDMPKLLTTLEQLAEALPGGSARADVLLRLGELREELQAHRPAEVEEAYAQALQAMPVPSTAAAHAALGRMRALMQKRSYGALAEVVDGLLDSLLPDEPLTPVVTALLTEERAFLTTQTTAGSSVLERAEAQLAKARQSLTSGAAGNAAYPEAVTLIELGRLRVAQKREDGKQQGALLAALAQHLLTLGDSEPKAAIGELWLRAGLLGALNEDEPAQQAEAARRLVAAYRVLGDVPQVVVPLCDLLADPALAEQLARAPEILPALRARQALCPPAEIDDRLQWLLLEAEVWLLQATDSQGVEIDAATRASCCHSAALVALAALNLDPHSVMALLLLRLATVPTAAEMDRGSGVALDAAATERVRAYALYTLRLAGELEDDEARAELYGEAAQLLLRLGDTDGAAAALRTVLQSRPLDHAAFTALHPLLTRRAEEGRDPGPLLELLTFRLALSPKEPGDELGNRSEQALRATLLLQRAGLLRQSGQDLDAESDLRALLEIDAKQALAHRWLAELRAQYADAEQAIHHYERFLELDAKPAERQVVHAAVAKLLVPTAPARAAAHLRQAIEFGERYRALRGDEVDTLEEVQAQIALHNWLSELQLQLGHKTESVATLRELLGKLPVDAAFADERQRVSLGLAEALEHHSADRAGALSVVEQVLKEVPVALPALERLMALAKAHGEPLRPQLALSRAASEARRRVAAQASTDAALDPVPFHALGQIFKWQGHADLHSLANQAESAVRVAAGQPALTAVATPPLKVPGRSVGPPLRTIAFPPEARGILAELWTEVADSANRILGSELTALGAQPRERLNTKDVPASWANVDQLANRFGLGSGSMTLQYGLFMARDKDLCHLSGNNLVCGSSYMTPLSSLAPGLFFKLARRLALLPDRMGPLEVEPQELVLFIAACCSLAQLPAPTLPADQKARLDERTRALDRVISRKERGAVKALGARLGPLAGSDGRDFIVSWQQAVLLGAAQLGLAIAGNLAAALDDLGISLRDGSAVTVRKARALCAFSVSADMQSLRRELGLSE